MFTIVYTIRTSIRIARHLISLRNSSSIFPAAALLEMKQILFKDVFYALISKCASYLSPFSTSLKDANKEFMPSIKAVVVLQSKSGL